MKSSYLSLSAVACTSLLLATTAYSAHSQANAPCSWNSIQHGSTVTLKMKNGDVVQGTVVSSSANAITLDSDNFGRLAVDLGKVATIGACASISSMTPGSVSVPEVAQKTLPAIPNYGLEALTLSMGFSGSAQRDQSYSVAPKFYAIQHKANGELRSRTMLFLSASYDDKWKAAARTSNVTHVYSGKLQQLFMLSGSSAAVLSGNAYSNNSQGIIVDQAYAIGGAKTFDFPKGKNSYFETDADLRVIHDETNAPGPTVLLAGSNLSFDYSKCFSAGQTCQASQSTSIVIKAGVIPVFNRSKSWQAHGTFDAFHTITKTWSIGLTAVDNYYEIAPKGFNMNYIKLGLSIKYVP